jgi:hypothetical protein
MYEYEPRIDEHGHATEAYRDFQNYLFSQPYGFLWDFPADKVVIYGTAYRISSLRHIPDGSQVTSLCFCNGGGGNSSGGTGTGGGTVISKIKTDVSLHGEGNEAHPLGVQLSQLPGNRLQILEDGCYVGSDPLPYCAPEVALSSSIAEGEYIKGDTLSNMALTVTVTPGSAPIRDVRILDGANTLHVFEIAADTYVYTFNLPTGVTADVAFTASISDGIDYLSNTLTYKFALPLFCGAADECTTVNEAVVLAATPINVPGSSFNYNYGRLNCKDVWMCCPENRVVKTITEGAGTNVTASFAKSAIKLTLAGEHRNYSLYLFANKTTTGDYKITFNF